MRSAPLTWSDEAGIFYAHTDYARLVKAQGAVVVVNDADEDETARQKVFAPAGTAVLGLGPNASCTKAATALLAGDGIRVISTVGAPSTFAPLDDPQLAHDQARAFADPEVRLGVAHHLYAGLFVDSPLVASTPANLIASIAEKIAEETYAKYAKRFSVARFHRTPGGADYVNRALTLTEGAVLNTAVDVCRLLGLSTALGFIRRDSRLAFAQDLTDSLLLDVTIPVGFIVGAQKSKDPALVAALVAEQLHHHRLIPKLVMLASVA